MCLKVDDKLKYAVSEESITDLCCLKGNNGTVCVQDMIYHAKNLHKLQLIQMNGFKRHLNKLIF